MIVRKSFFNNFYFEKKRKEKQRSNSIYYRNTKIHILILKSWQVADFFSDDNNCKKPGSIQFFLYCFCFFMKPPLKCETAYGSLRTWRLWNCLVWIKYLCSTLSTGAIRVPGEQWDATRVVVIIFHTNKELLRIYLTL
jgi:hypothetical protein